MYILRESFSIAYEYFVTMPSEKKSKKGWPKRIITTGYTYLTFEEKEAYHSNAVRQSTLVVTAKPKAPPKKVEN